MPLPAAARWIVSQKTNCEDLLLNWVAAEAIRVRLLAAQPVPPLGQPQPQLGQQAPERWPPHAVWVQPSRRLDISLLSGLRVGISRGRAAHEGGIGQSWGMCVHVCVPSGCWGRQRGRWAARQRHQICPLALLPQPPSLPLLHPLWLTPLQPPGAGV